MKLIPLTQGQFAIVDDEDFAWLSQWKWFARKVRNTFYAARSVRENGKKRFIHMHRLVNNTPDGLLTDHKNGDGLDNRRENLRDATLSQNAGNVGPRPQGTTSVKGIYFDKARGQWAADIQYEKKRTRLGRFQTQAAAMAAYDTAAKRLFGQFHRSES